MNNHEGFKDPSEAFLSFESLAGEEAEEDKRCRKITPHKESSKLK